MIENGMPFEICHVFVQSTLVVIEVDDAPKAVIVQREFRALQMNGFELEASFEIPPPSFLRS